MHGNSGRKKDQDVGDRKIALLSFKQKGGKYASCPAPPWGREESGVPWEGKATHSKRERMLL